MRSAPDRRAAAVAALARSTLPAARARARGRDQRRCELATNRHDAGVVRSERFGPVEVLACAVARGLEQLAALNPGTRNRQQADELGIRNRLRLLSDFARGPSTLELRLEKRQPTVGGIRAAAARTARLRRLGGRRPAAPPPLARATR